MTEVRTLSRPGIETEAVPVINPIEQLVPDGMIQELTVAEAGSRVGGRVNIELSTLTPIHSAQDGFNVNGAPGNLLAVIRAGRSEVGIIDTRPAAGYREGYVDDNYRFILAMVHRQDDSPFAPFKVERLPGSDSLAATYFNEPDTTTYLSRDNPSRPFQLMGVEKALDNDGALSRKHARFRLTEGGMLFVEDEKSLNGTKLIVRPTYEKRQASFQINTANARDISDNELVRVAQNGGREVDPGYRQNQLAVRNFLVDQFETGLLYMSRDGFTSSLAMAHRLASANGVYERVGEGGQFDENSPGNFRDWMAGHKRSDDARKVFGISSDYDSEYEKLFSSAGQGGGISHQVRLDGVDRTGLAEEIFEFDKEGNIEKYEFHYPDPEAIPQYIAKIYELGVQLDVELHKSKPDISKSLDIIAKQYQYGAIARAFDQINNSLFMNLANMQIKLLGLKGVTHQQMDLVAQRFQPDAFSRYFVDQVLNHQK